MRVCVCVHKSEKQKTPKDDDDDDDEWKKSSKNNRIHINDSSNNGSKYSPTGDVQIKHSQFRNEVTRKINIHFWILTSAIWWWCCCSCLFGFVYLRFMHKSRACHSQSFQILFCHRWFEWLISQIVAALLFSSFFCSDLHRMGLKPYKFCDHISFTWNLNDSSENKLSKRRENNQTKKNQTHTREINSGSSLPHTHTHTSIQWFVVVLTFRIYIRQRWTATGSFDVDDDDDNQKKIIQLLWLLMSHSHFKKHFADILVLNPINLLLIASAVSLWDGNFHIR